MDYAEFRYLWPPRPEKAVPSKLLGFYETRGFVAQVKLNGTCNVIAVNPSRELVCMNRHNQPHKAWQPTANSKKAFAALPGKGWYVFVAELMHSKVPGIRDINCINDILVGDGRHLVGRSFADRQKLLSELFTISPVDDRFGVVDDHTWVAKGHSTGFSKLYTKFDAPEDEGLVLKQAAAPLAWCTRAASNAGWQIKCRRAAKNYSF